MVILDVLDIKKGGLIKVYTRNKKLAVIRIGDQILFYREGNWFTEGYYQLNEIADLFGDRLFAFTAFGRIVESTQNINSFYQMPHWVVPKFAVMGPQVSGKGLKSYLFALPKLVWRAKKAIETHDVSWIMMPSLTGLVASLVAPKNKIKVVQLVGEWSMLLRLRYPKFVPVIVPLTEWLVKLSLKRANLAVFVSNYLAKKYGDGLKCKVIVANESRLQPWMIHQVDRSDVHKSLRVLFVGRLVPEKGVQFLLEAIALVLKEMPCELWIVGSGPYESFLKNKAKEIGIISCIRWFGWVPWGEELFKIMREADVLVMPSLPDIEGVGMVHFEAMSQSLPVIATQVDGIPEIVKDGISGILVNPSDSIAVAENIIKIARDSTLRQRLVSEGLKIARENTLEKQTGRVVSAICELVEKSLKDRN